jgi:hypothetical protein
MNSILIRQTIVGSLLVATIWIALLVSALLILDSIAGVHPAHTGIMHIAPPYQLV